MADINVSNKVPITYGQDVLPETTDGAKPTSKSVMEAVNFPSTVRPEQKSGMDASVVPTGPYSNLTGLMPSPPASVQGANHKENLASAKEKMTAGGAAMGALDYAVLSAESGKINRVGQKDVESIKEARAETVSKQADSILDSVKGTPQKHCPAKQADNKEMVGKMKALGFTDKQAVGLTRVLQEKNTPESTKARLSFELAALGMTGRGQENSRPAAANSGELKQDLAKFADEVGTKPGKKFMFAKESRGMQAVLDKNLTHTAQMSEAAPTAIDQMRIMPGQLATQYYVAAGDMAIDKVTNPKAFKEAASVL